MTEFNINKATKNALKIINFFGTYVVILDPDNNETKVNGAFDELDEHDIPSTNSEEEVRICYIAAGKVVPEIGDILKLGDDEEWMIDGVESYKPGKTAVAYRLRIRR